MKKKYSEPEIHLDSVHLERRFLSNDPTVSSSQDLVFDEEVDPW